MLVAGGAIPLICLPFYMWLVPESVRFLVVNNYPAERIARTLRRVVGGGPEITTQFTINEQKVASKAKAAALLAPSFRTITVSLWATYFMGLMVIYLLSGWLPTLIKDAGLPIEHAANTTALFQLGDAAFILMLASGGRAFGKPAGFHPAGRFLHERRPDRPERVRTLLLSDPGARHRRQLDARHRPLRQHLRFGDRRRAAVDGLGLQRGDRHPRGSRHPRGPVDRVHPLHAACRSCTSMTMHPPGHRRHGRAVAPGLLPAGRDMITRRDRQGMIPRRRIHENCFNWRRTMKRIVATAAMAACSSLACIGGAHAQSSVQVYGLLDQAVDYNTNVDAAGHSRTWLPSLGGGMFPSRLGFKGSEDLGHGLQAIFDLEMGIFVDTGNMGQANRLFGRQAWVGLAGKWGQLTLGRNYNMLFNSMPEVEIIGPTQYGLGSIEPAIPNGRMDNAVAYRGTFRNLTVGGAYSLGRDTSNAGGPGGTNCGGELANDAWACREWSAMLRYDTAHWGLTSAYDRKYGGPGAAAGLTSSNVIDRRAHLAAYAKYGAWRLATGALVRNNGGSATTPRSNLYYVNGAYRVAPAVTVDALAARLDYKNSPDDTSLTMLRAIYDFSKRTSTYVAIGHVANKGRAAIALSAGGTVGVGMAQNGVITGIKHAF